MEQKNKACIKKKIEKIRKNKITIVLLQNI